VGHEASLSRRDAVALTRSAARSHSTLRPAQASNQMALRCTSGNRNIEEIFENRTPPGRYPKLIVHGTVEPATISSHTRNDNRKLDRANAWRMGRRLWEVALIVTVTEELTLSS
jgi:hypothetical protein